MRLILEQKEVCELLYTSLGQQALHEAVAQNMQLTLEAPQVRFAVSVFYSFYEKFYNSCKNGEDGEKEPLFREVDVPEAVLLILKTLGFEEVRRHGLLFLRRH